MNPNDYDEKDFKVWLFLTKGKIKKNNRCYNNLFLFESKQTFNVR